MSAEERRKILQMVAEGKLSAEEAASLMRALAEDEDEAENAEAEVQVIQREPSSSYERSEAPEFDRIKSRARRFALIPLWVGVFVTVFSAWALYAVQQNAGLNFWFFCLLFPLMFGVLLTALGSGGRSARWIYVDVDRRDAKPGDGPRRITFGLPIPFGLVGWFFSSFGENIEGIDKDKRQAIAAMMEAAKHTKEPLMVNVDDDDAHVQVYIG